MLLLDASLENILFSFTTKVFYIQNIQHGNVVYIKDIQRGNVVYIKDIQHRNLVHIDNINIEI